MERSKSGKKEFRHGPTSAGSGAKAAARPRFSALPQDQIIFGLHAVAAALSNPNRRVKHAYLTENAAAKLEPGAAVLEIATIITHPPDLDALVGAGAVHQGAVLHTEPLVQPSLDDFLDALPDDAPAVLAMLDQVTDPHNVGAVLRSAAAFGIAALIVQDRHSPPLSGTLAKAASGALEHVPVIATVNLSRALDRLKQRGFQCMGFDSDATDGFDAKAAGPRVVLVFGAEDRGLRRLIREGCDTLAALFVPGPIKSLNISNAAAIAFYEVTKATS